MASANRNSPKVQTAAATIPARNSLRKSPEPAERWRRTGYNILDSVFNTVRRAVIMAIRATATGNPANAAQ